MTTPPKSDTYLEAAQVDAIKTHADQNYCVKVPTLRCLHAPTVRTERNRQSSCWNWGPPATTSRPFAGAGEIATTLVCIDAMRWERADLGNQVTARLFCVGTVSPQADIHDLSK
jgi:hypothetical protein